MYTIIGDWFFIAKRSLIVPLIIFDILWNAIRNSIMIYLIMRIMIDIIFEKSLYFIISLGIIRCSVKFII